MEATAAAFSATRGANDTSTRCEYASEYYYGKVDGLFSFAKEHCRGKHRSRRWGVVFLSSNFISDGMIHDGYQTNVVFRQHPLSVVNKCPTLCPPLVLHPPVVRRETRDIRSLR